MRMEKSVNSGLQKLFGKSIASQISGLEQYKLCGSQGASIMYFELIPPAVQPVISCELVEQNGQTGKLQTGE